MTLQCVNVTSRICLYCTYILHAAVTVLSNLGTAMCVDVS